MGLAKKPAVGTGIVQMRRKPASKNQAAPSGAFVRERPARAGRVAFAQEASVAVRDFTTLKDLVRDVVLAEALESEPGGSTYLSGGRPIVPAAHHPEDTSRAQHREKMETVGQLASGLAHDLGNVLAAIRLNLGAIQQRPLNATTKTIINSAIAAADDGQRVIRSLLFLCRHDPPRVEPFDATSALSRIALLMRHSFDGKVQTALSIAPDIWPILGDESQLELAILNLGVNGRDAMPDGGRLRITARNMEGATIAPGVAGDFVVITVTDTGTGMSRQVAAKAFEPFFTTKGPEKGTGLGLSQVRRFAKNCSGMVTLDSTLGRGTTVTLYLRAKRVGALRH